MSHTTTRFTKYNAKSPATWYQIKAITRLATITLGYTKYKVGLSLQGKGFTVRRKTTQTDWKQELLYDPKDALTLHFGSETKHKTNTNAKIAALTAKNKYNAAVQHKIDTKQRYMDIYETKLQLEAKMHQANLEQKQIITNMKTRQAQCNVADERCTQSLDLQAHSLAKKEEAIAQVTMAEQHVKQIKKSIKKAKKMKKSKKKALKEKARAGLEAAELNLNTRDQEWSNYQTLVEKNQVDLTAAKTIKEDIELLFQKSTQLRQRNAMELRTIMKRLVDCSKTRVLAHRLYKKTQAINDYHVNIIHTTIQKDQTFINWPSMHDKSGGYPNDFKNHQAWTMKDDVELMTNNDKTVDLYFNAHCGQTWTKQEQITIAACIGHVLGWLAIGGTCCTAVQMLMQDMLVREQQEEEKKRKEKLLLEARWKRDGMLL